MARCSKSYDGVAKIKISLNFPRTKAKFELEAQNVRLGECGEQKSCY